MAHPKFDEKELQIVGEMPGMFPGMPGTPMFDYPASLRDAYLATMKREPIWQLTGLESKLFAPAVNPENISRGMVMEANSMPPQEGYVKDMFGIEWIFIPTAGGSIERTDVPHPFEDANDWKDVLQFPDIDSYDWEGSAKANNGTYLTPERYNTVWVQNGFWFERLISFMGFVNAATALIDEDQKDALHELFEATTDLGIRLVDKFVEHFDYIDGFTIHDDWGSQRSPFFSEATAMEMIVPYMKKIVDHIHSKGLIAELHSCGHIESRVPCMIAAGWDAWSPQPMNDTKKIYEEYGDQIIISVAPEVTFDPETATEEEQRAAAAEFVEKYCQDGKPATLGFGAMAMMTPAFREELYKLSRMKYCEN